MVKGTVKPGEMMLSLVIEESLLRLGAHWKRLAAYTAVFVVIIAAMTAAIGPIIVRQASAAMQLSTQSAIRANGLPSPTTPANAGMLEMLSSSLGVILIYILVALVAMNVLIAAMIRACSIPESWNENLHAAFRQLPAHGAQTSVLTLPLLVAMVVTSLTGSLVLAGLLALAAIPYFIVMMPLYLLVSADCALGARAWLPTRSWHNFTRAPGACIGLALLLILASMLVSIIPLAGPIISLASLAVMAAVSSALHEHLNPTTSLSAYDRAPQAASQTPLARNNDANPAASANTPQQSGLMSLLPAHVPPTSVHSGTSQPNAPWQEWVGMPLHGVLVLRVTSPSGAAASLTLADQHGTPIALPGMYADGSTYVTAQHGWILATVASPSHETASWQIEVYPMSFDDWNTTMSRAA